MGFFGGFRSAADQGGDPVKQRVGMGGVGVDRLAVTPCKPDTQDLFVLFQPFAFNGRNGGGVDVLRVIADWQFEPFAARF